MRRLSKTAMNRNVNIEINSYPLGSVFWSDVPVLRKLVRIKGVRHLLFSREAGCWTQTPSLVNTELVMLSFALVFNHVLFPLELIQRAPFVFHGNIIQSYMNEDILGVMVASMSLPKKELDLVAWAIMQDLIASPTPDHASICISFPTVPGLPTPSPSNLATTSLVSSPCVSFV